MSIYTKCIVQAKRQRLCSEATNAFQNSIVKSIQNYGTDNENYGYTIIDKEGVYQSNVGTSVIVSFIAIYIGLIFLITCVAILALQQLAEASDNTVRYNLLRKLGADPKMIHHALFTQIAIYFCYAFTACYCPYRGRYSIL